jgi:hypothetical protein
MAMTTVRSGERWELGSLIWQTILSVTSRNIPEPSRVADIGIRRKAQGMGRYAQVRLY